LAFVWILFYIKDNPQGHFSKMLQNFLKISSKYFQMCISLQISIKKGCKKYSTLTLIFEKEYLRTKEFTLYRIREMVNLAQ